MKIRHSFFLKLFISFFLLSTIPLNVSGYLTYRNIEASLNDKLNQDTASKLEQYSSVLTFYMNDLERMSQSIAGSRTVSDFLKNTSEDAYPAYFLKLDELIGSVNAIRPENVGITIISDNGFVYNYGYSLNRDDKSLYEYGRLRPPVYSDRPQFTPVHSRPYSNGQDDQPVFSYLKTISSSNLKSQGLLMIDFHVDVLNRLMNSVYSFGPGNPDPAVSGILITNRQGQLLYPETPAMFTADDLKASPDAGRIMKNNRFYRLIHRSEATTGWTITAYFQEDKLYEPIYKIRKATVITTITSALVCLLVSLLMSRKISEPVRRLRMLMKRVGQGDFNLHFDVRRQDEIGALGAGFNQMVKKIKALIDLVYLEQNEKRRAEVAALQSQINPHFLYNTLESINALARKNKEPEISKMIVLLGKLLRNSISTFDDMVPIAKELEYARLYLEIHKYRQKTPIEYEIEVDPRIAELYTVKWIVQPVIENAVIHGLDPKQEGGKIGIRGWLDNEDVYIRIQDQGVGMRSEALEAMRFNLEHHSEHFAKQRNKVGLYNVQSRIQLHFGKAYGILVDSIYGEGMTVTIILPRRTAKWTDISC